VNIFEGTWLLVVRMPRENFRAKPKIFMEVSMKFMLLEINLKTWFQIYIFQYLGKILKACFRQYHETFLVRSVLGYALCYFYNFKAMTQRHKPYRPWYCYSNATH